MTYRQPFRGDFRISQRYGDYIEGVTVGTIHTGIDYACPLNTPILASEAGTVMACGWDNTGYGYRVILKHGDGRATLYAHLNKVCVTLYELVAQGDQIGLSGSSGKSTGPHLHFEARRKWNDYKAHFDPMTLPLQNFADFAEETAANPEETQQNPAPTSQKLKGADAFQAGSLLKITAPLGAKAFFSDVFEVFEPLPQWTELYYTGKTAKHNGYTYMQVVPMQRPRWIAVHDNDTQIIDEEA